MAAAGLDLAWGEVLPTSGRGRAPRPEASTVPRTLRRRVRRGRAALVAAALSAVVAVCGAGAAAGSSAAPPDPGATTRVVVAPGDTLWTLAARHAPEGTDPQAWAVRVVADNGVDAGALVPGSVLNVPLVGDDPGNATETGVPDRTGAG